MFLQAAFINIALWWRSFLICDHLPKIKIMKMVTVLFTQSRDSQRLSTISIRCSQKETASDTQMRVHLKMWILKYWAGNMSLWFVKSLVNSRWILLYFYLKVSS